MLSREFIFSEKRGDSLKRHLVFWLFWWLFFGTMHAVQPFNPALNYVHKLPYSISESILLLVPQVLLVYPLLYIVLPRFVFKNRYTAAIIWTIILVLACGVVNLMMIDHVNSQLLAWLLPAGSLPDKPRPQAVNFAMGVIGSLKGGVTCAAFAVGLKFAKHWYLKEQSNLQLQKENTEAQLQLLTAQVHPHFLFNTLNNIYSNAQTESPGSAAMIMELSHILRYVLDEGRNIQVPLENELQMVRDYINLERRRYDEEKLVMHTAFPEKSEDIFIAPLLLLPFVENCFKHGTSKMIDHPWINLKVELQETMLVMKLMNGKKQSQNSTSGRKGTGIENVKRRLELLYKGRHELKINEDEEVFVVNLAIELSKNLITPPVSTTVLTEQYA